MTLIAIQIKLKPRSMAFLIGATVSWVPLGAQFGIPSDGSVRERIAGELLFEGDVPPPMPGDQLGAFFGDALVGSFTFTSETIDTQFELTIFGDDPSTTPIEGAPRGAAIEIRFFDASTNTVRTDLRFENPLGEVFNYRYQGQAIPSEFEGLPFPLDLTPTIELNIRLGVEPETPVGGAPPGRAPTYDVDANGRIDSRDAAIVLRIVSGARRGATLEQITRADVNGDGFVSTADAIEILRSQ